MRHEVQHEYHDKFWKAELSDLRVEIALIRISHDHTTEDFFKAEKSLIYSAVVIRKLIEDVAVTDKLKSKSVSLLSSPSTRNGEPVFLETMLGPLDPQREFGLGAKKSVRLSYFDLSSEIIHADGIIWSLDGEFLVFSHRNTLNRALWVSLKQYLSVLDNVLKDNPIRWFTLKDLITGKVTRHAE